jgi:predicted N-acyltransferase
MLADGLRVLDWLAEVPQKSWDALVDPAATPFLEWGWLESLESSGCVAPASGCPRHLTLWRRGQLIAAAPAYAKDGSDGDFSRDWDFAHAAQRARAPFYPKLVLGVPFTPCTGRRILVAPGEDRAACTTVLLQAARELCRAERLPTLEVLFPDPAEAHELEQRGLAVRVDFQFHWRNASYGSIDEFLARFNSKRRAMIRRERAAPAEQGIELRTIRGAELADDPIGWGRQVYSLHRATIDKLPWGRGWLNRKFYELALTRLPDKIEIVEARRDGRIIAGAFNVASATHLYGRYWGCLEEHKFLHFNVCLYHSVQECIARGVQVFEGGAGGEHKLPRGFEPSPTFCAFEFQDGRLDASVRRFLRGERLEREESLERWRAEAGLLKPLAREAG